jgi:archaellum component FlaF (FlaF/FlaG flagellin family)
MIMKTSALHQTNEDGVSETIGAVLLIGLTVIGVSLISVILFSQPLAEELPAVDIIVSNNDTTIFFQHNGGDSLGKDEFTIFVEGSAVDPDDLHIADSGDGEWPWSVGETLWYSAALPENSLSENVRMVYGESDSGSLIRPVFVDDAGATENRVDVVPGPLPVYTPGATQTPSPAEAGNIVAESVLADSHVIAAFTSMSQGAVIVDRYFNFTVMSSNATMNIPDFPAFGDLDVGDQIVIRTAGNQQASGNRISITGVGQTLFSLRFEKVNVWKNGVLITKDKNGKTVEAEIKSGWIPEYSSLESTLAFKLVTTYELYIDGVLDPRGDTTTILLNNVRPTESGMFVINAWSPKDNENSVILAEADIIENP